jgi:hypothetical protein
LHRPIETTGIIGMWEFGPMQVKKPDSDKPTCAYPVDSTGPKG